MGFKYTVSALLLLAIVAAAAIMQKLKEHFGSSQGGALIQLMAGRVSSEHEVAMEREYNKRRVAEDIIGMTEPERKPYPANL